MNIIYIYILSCFSFQKAADELAAKCKLSEKETIQKQETQSVDEGHSLPGVSINLRFNKQKLKFKVVDVWTGDTILTKISNFVSCLKDNMKVIHKGKQLNSESIREVISPGAVFQVRP